MKEEWHNGILPGKEMPYSPIIFKGKSNHLQNIISNDNFTLIAFIGIKQIDTQEIKTFL